MRRGTITRRRRLSGFRSREKPIDSVAGTRPCNRVEDDGCNMQPDDAQDDVEVDVMES